MVRVTDPRRERERRLSCLLLGRPAGHCSMPEVASFEPPLFPSAAERQ